MIVGRIVISDGKVITHRSIYYMTPVSVTRVHQPFLSTGVIFAAGFGGFALTFADLLYPSEQMTLWALAGLSLICGYAIAQLRFASRDLRNSELATVIWGSVGALRRLSLQIDAAKPKTEVVS